MNVMSRMSRMTEWQASLKINFIYFEKTFDSKYAETLWKIMEEQNKPSAVEIKSSLGDRK